MGKLKSKWFEGSNQINCELNQVNDSFADLGKHFSEVVALMPGMKDVKLIEQGEKFVTIETNEGIMNRTNISVKVESQQIIIEFDEMYQAGKTVTTHAHFMHEFISKGKNIIHRISISKLSAPGFLGFLYKNFGSSSMGKSFLETYKTYFET